MESERMRKIDDAIAGVTQTAMKEHYSPGAVAQVLATAFKTVVSSMVEELDEIIDRVTQAEQRLQSLEQRVANLEQE
jgi:hypothetical protein